MTSENCEHSTANLPESLPLRVNNISSTECLEKVSSGAYESENKKVAFEAQTPRSPLAASNSCNDALKNSSGRCKRPSMIPKSKSIKRTEKGNVKIEMSVQSEEVCVVWNLNKKQLTKKTELEPDEPQKIVVKKPKQESPLENIKADDMKREAPVKETQSKEVTKQLETETSSMSLKSCTTAIDIHDEGLTNSGHSATSTKSQLSEYGDAEEDLINCTGFNHELSQGGKEVEKVAGNQDRGIQTLYEILKSTGPMFDDFKYLCEKNSQNVSTKDWHNFSVQKCYNVTLEEISDIWKNTMSLISSVKDHAIKFIEKKEVNFLDREQLFLEGEMVQLAIDFAINYSKLKTDFLIKSVSERLGVKNLAKSNLEGFMDSKTFAGLYSDDDLAKMSRTIKDLNTNVLKEEDLEVR